MDERTQLTLIRGIKSGALDERQQLEAIRALKSNDDSKVADILGSLAFSTLNSGKTLKQLMDERQSIDRENFDYTTGAGSGLRSLMSFGETPEDREAILRSIVGEEGYVKDAAGRLALTEAGQRARGMEPVGKNLIIEDEGFSLADLSDLTGALPETIGSVVGATVGGGLTFGLGSIAGAGLGGAAGQAIEEGIETLLGVQTQEFKDVVKDVAIEGAIGAGGELIGAGVVAAGRGLMGGAGALGRRAMQGPADEIAEQTLARAESLTERGFVPSVESVGGPRPLALFQKFSENAARDMSRLDENLQIALRERDEFLKGIGADVAGELREDLMFVAPSKFAQLQAKERAAQQAYMKAIDAGIDTLETAIDSGFDLNKETLGQIAKSFTKFNDDAAENFGLVDEILSRIQIPAIVDGRQVLKEGGKAKVFDTTGLNRVLSSYLEDAGNIELLDPSVQTVLRTVRGYKDNKASFRNLARLRKEVNDNRLFNPGISTEGGKQLDTLNGILNNMLDEEDILTRMRANITQAERQTLASAAKQRKFAIDAYREGIQRFEKLSRLGVIRSINDLKGEEPRVIADRFFSRVVKPDEPERLEAVLGAVDDADALRSSLARSYLDDALSNAGRDLNDPESFSGTAFYNHIKKLKDTGKVLFGKDWGRVQSLARALRQSSIKGIDMDTIMKVSAEAEGKPIASALQDVLDAQIDLKQAREVNFLKRLNEGQISIEDAVAHIASPSRTDSDVMRVMEFFSGQPDIQNKIKQLFLTEILSSVDENIFKSQKNADSLLETIQAYKPNVLNRVLGKETTEALISFGKDLSMLGDVGKEGSIAAASIWANFFKHPINALASIGKFKLIARMFNNPELMNKYIRMRRQTAGDPQARADAMIAMLDGQMMENGMDIRRVTDAARKAGQVAGAGLSTARQTAVRIPGQQQSTRTEVPAVEPSALAPVFSSVPEPAPRAAQSQRLSPIQAIQQEAIRKRAAENPAVAASLLGGLGSAALLNR